MKNSFMYHARSIKSIKHLSFCQVWLEVLTVNCGQPGYSVHATLTVLAVDQGKQYNLLKPFCIFDLLYLCIYLLLPGVGFDIKLYGLNKETILFIHGQKYYFFKEKFQ